jgi:hypothetical protein
MLVLEEHMRFLVEEEKKYQNKINEIEKQFGSLAFQALPHKILLRKIKIAQQEITKDMSAQEQSELMRFLVEGEKKHQNNIDEIEKQLGSLEFKALPHKILLCKNKLAQDEDVKME